MVNQKSISIIIPIYNVEDYLEQCLESIISQTSTDFVAILINDGSTDNSHSIAQHYTDLYPEKFILFAKVNGGLSDARNFGIEKADTEYVMFVDSDDYIESNTIAFINNEIEKNRFDILCFGMTEVSENSQHIRNIPATTGKWLQTSLTINPNILSQALPNACNKVIKKSLFTTNNIKFPKGVWYEDLSTLPKLYCHAKTILFIEDYFYHYRTRVGSITQTINPKILDMLLVLNDLDEYFKDNEHREKLEIELNTLSINMLMKTLVRISASSNSNEQQIMLEETQIFIKKKFKNVFNQVLKTKSKFIYKLSILLTYLKFNTFVLTFLTYCLKKGLVRA